MRAVVRSFVLISALIAFARTAHADEPSADGQVPRVPEPNSDGRPPLGFLPEKEDAFCDPRMTRSWSEGPSRFFLATTVDLGFVYARPRASVGWGKPFTSWIGLDANPIATSNGVGVYGGLRLEIPYVDLRIGPRYFVSFNRSFLPEKHDYDRLDVQSDFNDQAQVLTYEAELDGSIPVGPGNILARGSVSYVTNVPNGKEVYEETLHVIVKPPWVWRARAGYALRLGQYSQHSVGLVGDVLGSPARGDDAIFVRAGPVLRIVLSRRVEVRGTFVLGIASRDRIGLDGSDFTELGVRYRWATE